MINHENRVCLSNLNNFNTKYTRQFIFDNSYENDDTFWYLPGGGGVRCDNVIVVGFY